MNIRKLNGLLEGMFEPSAVLSACQKENVIVDDLGMADYLQSDVGVLSDYKRAGGKRPACSPKPKRRDESPAQYTKRKRDYKAHYKGMLKNWEAAQARFEKQQELFRCHEQLTAALAVMDNQELTYAFLSTENSMLSQAYTGVMEERKLLNKPLSKILGGSNG